MVIDIHTHCFPAKIAERALSSLSLGSGNMPPCTDGTAEGLLSSMDKGGIDISCVMNIATNPRQMHAVNDFAASIKSDRLIPFGSVHPDAPDASEELCRIKEMGLKGVKLHPEYQGFYADEERMRPIYKKISELSLTVLFHAGGDIAFGEPYHAMPENLVGALKYLDTNVIAAHWGGAFFSCEVLRTLCGLPLYFDTSFGQGVIPTPQAKRIIEKHGAEKILFGTDTPWHTPAQELGLMNALGLSAEEKEAILYKNAAKLLQIGE